MQTLHTLAITWCVFFLVLLVATVVGLFKHKPISTAAARLRTKLFDFSGGDAEAAETYRLLTAALDESATDSEFEASYKRLSNRSDDFHAEASWSWLERILVEYRLANELTADTRIIASHYRDDLARRYNLG